ncbi:prolyl oligopeptidase family serine peptidase [Alteromonas sp. MYP5]|uniref:Prolyl oligopeptidase family serine peptidase n=2 Tax=Alteromonas ponticola TaxID=2720613 RepID=A0ABX1R4W2_9ALTE|nr:prolyl oligopeptidase family serine peptidase [Alteromonas ponticola]
MLSTALLLITLLATSETVAEDYSAYSFETYDAPSGQLLYRKLLPTDFDPNKKYPLVVFLHGAGERGASNQKQLTHGGELFLDKRESFPAIVVFPQIPEQEYWASIDADRSKKPYTFEFPYRGKDAVEPTAAMTRLLSFLDHLQDEAYVDNSRIYIGGLSMGGMGTLEILARRPNMFAAAFAICGGADPALANVYREELPLWFFHGAKDDIVEYKYSRQLADAMSKRGQQVKYTLYPEANHNSWDPALAEPDLLSWLFAQQLGTD